MSTLRGQNISIPKAKPLILATETMVQFFRKLSRKYEKLIRFSATEESVYN
jgi:uncharacterized protein YsxB (DUF464 family)